MKKILSILICVLLSISSAWADLAVTITTKASPEGCGTALVCAHDYENGDSEGVVSRQDDQVYSTSETAHSNTQLNIIIAKYGKNVNALADLKAENTKVGYLFSHWEGPDSYDYGGRIGSINISYTPNKNTEEVNVDFGYSSRSGSANITMIAHFKPYYAATLYGYDSNEDKFNIQPLGNVAPWSATYSDGLTLNVGQFENLYKVSLTHPIDDLKKIKCSSSQFYCTIKTIGADTVLVVSNKGAINGTVSGNVLLSVEGEWNSNKVAGGTIATLNLTVSNEPIYVTLNPAENLLGTYTYTQNTTGNQQFEVTTSPVIKEMITSTDYSFTFNPTSIDATKYKFAKWVVKNAMGNVVYESITANLSYQFSAGESITPIFVPIDLASYIVKSEPSIVYYDLQQALDRADALTTSTGQPQTVVVTSSTGKLLQGNYTIRNGVTLLIPGESSYTALLGDLNNDNFSSSGTYKTYCKLSVEDNTKITVENGNISIYAKLTTTQAGISNKKGSVYEHGHLELGKNCEIDVKKGGLYAFGFITGDNSNKITMRKNTIAYEPFHMTDWRGGGETVGNWVDVWIVGGTAGIESRVFPIGQYYIQNVEVPMTFESGSKEKISCCVDASLADATINMTLISTYNEECLFGLGDGTTLTKSYDPATDRVKYEYKGTGASSSKVKLGCMNLRLDVSYINVDVNSKDYVMPIQNNIDVDVKNTTIDVEYDMAFMPGSTMRVHDNAVINVGDEDGKYKPNVYIYDRGARKLNNGSPYWFSSISGYTEPIIPVYSKFRPGGIKYRRTDANLYDACLIINGDMNIRGGLYTVKGAWAEADALDPEALGGANITSEGSGKINVYSLGSNDVTVAKQWLQDVGVQELALTSPKLLLHNDLSKGAASAYTPVTETGISYTYYQYDGTWREPKAGATGVKLYDSEGNEIENFLVTLPTTTSVDGYLLVTLEQTGDAYNVNDFTISLEPGAISCLGENTIVDGNLKVPVRYTTKDVQGPHTQTLTIEYSGCAECDLVTPISAIEDYTPVFKVPTSLNIYARINERTPGSLPITAESDNVVSLAENNTVNLTWDATIEGTNKTMFEFALGEGTGNKLAGASVYFTPNNTTKRTATLKLTAKYTDSEGNEITSATHSIPLTGNGLMIDNTLDFNNVGTITVNTSSFELLKYINSTGKITYTVLEGTVNQAGSPIDIAVVDANANNSNYTITPNAVGQVKLEISQAETTTHTAKTITTTIIVVADPQPLVTEMCLDDSNFSTLTADIEHAKYEDDKLKFEGDGVISSWTAQFSTMPGTLTFTPHGDGYWAVQESKDGINWSEIIWWTQLPSDESVTYALHPTTRRVKISYNKVSEDGYISQLCITPFTVHAETTKIYAPVVGGEVQPTSVVFTHSTPSVTFEGSSGWTVAPLAGSTTNLGGVLNTYYQTTVTVSGGTSVEELNNGFELKATQGTDEAVVIIGTYTFPKPLPMESEEWVSDDDPTNNFNDYDESEYYYHYMRTSKNVKWDAERENLVFMNVGSKTGESAKRQVVFGYFGLPDVVRFQSTATDWTIEQSTNGIDWNPVDGEARTINTVGEVHSIAQTVESASQYVRITYTGTQQDEVLLSKLVIEGLPSAVPSSSEVQVSKGEPESSETFSVHVKNLPSMQLSVDNTVAFSLQYQKGGNWVDLTNALTTSDFDCLAVNQQGDITFKVIWNAAHMLDEGAIQIINPNQNDSVMAVIRLVGKKDEISSTDVNTGIWTGVPDGEQNGSVKYSLESTIFDDYDYHEVTLNNTFSNDQKALFDYLIIYGETTTDDATTTITKPTAEVGSNAKTPYYVYKKNANSTGYDFVSAVANANISEKALVGDFIVNDDTATVCINAINAPLRVYMTGFCPYATTGYTKNQEGVFLFRGKHGSQLDIYLEDCHIYSRNKTEKGSTFYGDKEGGEIYSDKYARGSGGVLVFENVDAQEQLQNYDPFEVSIHTIGNNLLNSNHGCFFGLKIGVDVAMKAYQVSSPIQIHMLRDGYERKTKTNLTFDDLWPTAVNASNEVTASTRTNGFLALKKQANNAPSIDLGNQYTVVNFNGGQVQLQNSQIGSDTYKTTLAISYRAGLFGADGAGIKLCYGIGTDAVDGTVNFNDGTVTVERMWVDPAYRQYYLMDEVDGVETGYTTCLRTPKNTFIKGGSICRVRACVHVTSKGGGPRVDASSTTLLGQYVYEKQEGDTEDPNTHLVTINGFPSSVNGLESYAYNLNSVTADANKKFYFWIPNGYGGVEAEQDKLMSTWKACMTQIAAGIPGVAEGTVGGDIEIDDTEEVKYFLYCQLDDNTYDVISDYDGETSDGKKKYTYKAPIEVPSAAREFFKGDYTRWAPNEVGEFKQYQVTSDAPYTITDKAYYITTATADVWQTFTAPFDVANIYVVETFSEKELEKKGTRAEILEDQAIHNADFAAFFGVAMAMGTDKSFEQIFDSYINWGMMMDRDSFLLYDPVKHGNYTLRGMQKLTPYFGNNWRDANFYLNVNNGEWTYDDSNFGFESHWEMLTQAGWDEEGILLHKGETYSMLFPYCTGCGTDLDSREYWDYWSGKFLIFESTDEPQTINGRDYLDKTTQGNIFTTKTSDVDNNVVVTGNSTFAYMTPIDEEEDVYVYVPLFKDEYFDDITSDDVLDKTIYPTNAFLYGGVPAHPYTNMPAKRVTREGKIIYGESGDNNGDPNNGTTTGSHTPTVGGGNDMFITAIDGGINIAVAVPQNICVVNATGHILYNGYVTTNTNVLLPMNGIYVVKGQNEVQKIFF